jgi:hypothetical protein
MTRTPRSRALRRCVALAAAVLAGACSEKDPVRALLEELEEAAEARDADRFGERLSVAATAGPSALPKAEALALLRRYFAGYDSVALTVYGVEVERAGGTARVRCVVEFTGNVRKLGGLEGLLPPEAVYRFDLQAADEDGTWRVRSVQWEEVQPPAASPD